MSISVSAQLRRIDEEITSHRRQIAVHQIEIVRLEDARLVISALAEQDQARPAKGDQLHINGAQRPVLVVRKTAEEEPKPKKPKKPRSERINDQRSASYWRDKIIEFMRGREGEPITSNEIGNYHGLPHGDKARKPVQNAFYYLRKKGVIRIDENSPGGLGRGHAHVYRLAE